MAFWHMQVINLHRFKPGQELQAGLLWVVEQIPGFAIAADQTATLERGYWPSYNVPFYQETYRQGLNLAMSPHWQGA